MKFIPYECVRKPHWFGLCSLRTLLGLKPHIIQLSKLLRENGTLSNKHKISLFSTKTNRNHNKRQGLGNK